MSYELPLKLHPGRFSLSRLDPESPVPHDLLSTRPCFIGRTDKELSIISPARVDDQGPRFRMLSVDLTFSTTEVGVLKSIADPLAASGVSILAVCTHDTDHVLVEESRLDDALRALRDAGHTVTE